jgi:hypothetical protein
MLTYKVTRSAILCFVALLAIPLLASARPKSTNTQMEKKSIDLDRTALIDGKTLAPGKYEVVIEGNKINFERDGQTVATAQCDWKTLQYKSQYNSTTFSAKNVLQELEFEGSKQALEIL